MPRSKWDHADTSYPASWIVWQKPLRLTDDDKYLAGFTRWTSLSVKKNPTRSWISMDSRVEFMRFDNLDDNPRVANIAITYSMSDDASLAVPFPEHPEVSSCQEPSIVKLPDGRLFCVMRTAAGSPYWSLGTANGQQWSSSPTAAAQRRWTTAATPAESLPYL